MRSIQAVCRRCWPDFTSKGVQGDPRCVALSPIFNASSAKFALLSTGRWPVKSAKFMRDLLKNAESNAIANELASEDLSIRNVVVQQAPVSCCFPLLPCIVTPLTCLLCRKHAAAHTALTVVSTRTKDTRATLKLSSALLARKFPKRRSLES